ncbi:hypothetical protein HDU77_001189, partial [Chytriomyces hyalinus]
ESTYFRALASLYALFANHLLDPADSELTHKSLRHAVHQASKASQSLVAPEQLGYCLPLQMILNDIDADKLQTLTVTHWATTISHVLGFPPVDPFAAALAQHHEESIRARRKLLQSASAPAAGPSRAASSSKRSAPVQPSASCKQPTSSCGHCGKQVMAPRRHNAKNCKSSCTVAGCGKNGGCPAYSKH